MSELKTIDLENYALFALTILRIINLQFETDAGANPNFIGLTNQKGNKIYVSNSDGRITISAYKISKRCYNKSITNLAELEPVVEELKLLVTCKDNLITNQSS